MVDVACFLIASTTSPRVRGVCAREERGGFMSGPAELVVFESLSDMLDQIGVPTDLRGSILEYVEKEGGLAVLLERLGRSD